MSQAISFRFEGSNLFVEVDPNNDGEPVVSVKLDLAEISDEVLSAIKSRKEPAQQ